jgi:preprotein translocase subunit SecG
MTILLMIVHILACLFLIAVVLLQSGKGAEIGAAFGGSSQTLFGSRGSASFLSKMTTVVAVVFMVTSLTLAVVTSKGSSVLKKVPAGTSIPAAPGPLQGVQPQPQTQQLPQPSQPVQQKAAQVRQPAKPVKHQKATQAPQPTLPAPQAAPAAPAQSTPQPAPQPQLPPAQ